MRKTLLLLALCSIPFSFNAQVAEKIELTSNNDLLGLGKQYIIKSDILQEDRPIVISLPVGYHESQAHYPVIYVLDGFQNIKHNVGTIELLTESGLIPPMIIVGIQSLDRSRDLTPSNAGQNAYGGAGNAGIPQSGGAPKFLDFIGDELIPFVEANYRTHPYRILEGHSLGGLFGVFALMDSSDLFDAFIIEAPALWWNKEEMTEKAKTFFNPDLVMDKSVYFGVGGREGWGMRQELLRYVEVVKENTPKNFKWIHEEVGDEDHMASRLLLTYNGLKFLFSDLKVGDELIKNYSDRAFLEGEQQLMKKYGEKTRRLATDYFNIVSEQVNNENFSGAITVLERTSEAYPNYIGILTYLAGIYEKTDQNQKAIDTYIRAVEVSEKYKLGEEEDLRKEINRLKNGRK